jgi:hypothetical protein
MVVIKILFFAASPEDLNITIHVCPVMGFKLFFVNFIKM